MTAKSAIERADWLLRSCMITNDTCTLTSETGMFAVVELFEDDALACFATCNDCADWIMRNNKPLLDFFITPATPEMLREVIK